MTEKKLNRVRHRRIISPRMICYTGFRCNLRCRFCYYLESLESDKVRDRTSTQIRRQLWVGRRLFRKTEVEFTGGEPTVMSGFVDLIAYARTLGYQEIGLITNGLRMADMDYCRQLKEAGLNDILFSFHSYDPKIHDWLTQAKKSHEKLEQAVRNVKALRMDFRFNSVVTPANSLVLKPHLEFLAKFEPCSVNLIIFNPSEETANYESHNPIRFSTYDDIGERLAEAIEAFRGRIPILNVRFIPFCFLKGHEAHIRNYWQAIYEAKEWDPFLHMGYRKGFMKVALATLAGLFFWPFTLSRYGKKSFYTQLCEWMQSFRIHLLFRQPPACRRCALRLICGGFQREFFKKYGTPKVYPYTDMPLVRNPVLFASPRYTAKFPGLAAEKASRSDSVDV
jgi:MoaA/NifB/PqqE/SkfB family radical SAM enzyme